MNKKRRGFSYVEMIVALGVFAMVVAVALPTIHQAGRNMYFAENYYRDNLQAQSIMLTVRHALNNGQDIYIATPPAFYRVWVDGVLIICTNNVPDVVLDLNTTATGQVIVVAIFNQEGLITGRSIGVAV